MKKRMWIFILSVFCVLIALSSITAFAVESNKASTPTENQIIEVPTAAMVIKEGVYYGIDKTWFAAQNPDKTTLYFSLKIPDSVTEIARDAFTDIYASGKSEAGAVNVDNKLGRYNVVKIDFSEATNLETISMQAAMQASSLTGVLDLSNTQVKEIGFMHLVEPV